MLQQCVSEVRAYARRCHCARSVGGYDECLVGMQRLVEILLSGQLRWQQPQPAKRTFVADGRPADLLEPCLPNGKHLFLVQFRQVRGPAQFALFNLPSFSSICDVCAVQRPMIRQAAMRTLMLLHALLHALLCVTVTNSLVVEDLVGPPAEHRAQRVAEVLREAHVLQLFVLVEDREDARLGALRHLWINVALRTSETLVCGFV